MLKAALVGMIFALPLCAQPTVVSTSPIANSRSVVRTSNINSTFSTPMAGASASTFPVNSSQRGRRAGSYGGASSTTLDFDPAQNFFPGENVSATLTSGLQSTGAVPLGQPRVWQFTAAAGLAPGIFNFKAPYTGFTGNSQAMKSMSAGDLDSDGDIDWVTGFENHNQCLVHINAGNGTFPFSATGLTLAGTCMQCVKLADMDNDGDLDIVLGCYGVSNQNYVFLNDGAGNFPTYHLWGTGADNTLWIGCADMDGDGDNDIVCGNDGQQSGVYLNDGAANFGTFTTFGPAAGSIWLGSLGDLDLDGDIDLFSVNATTTVSSWFNSGTGALGSAVTFTVNGYSVCCALADLDGDNDLDVALSAGGQPNQFYRNNGSGSFGFGANVTTDLMDTNELLAADFDGDSDIDLIPCCAGAAPNQSYLYSNDGTGVFTRGAAVGAGGSLSACGMSADFDGDGDLDVLLGRRNGGVHELRYNASQSPVITNISLPSAQEGVNYSVQLAATGGQAPYTWYITSAPAWLTLGVSSGLLSGTPPIGIAPAQFTVAVRVFDSVNEQGNSSWQLDVFDGSPTITSLSLPDAQEGTAYSYGLTAVQGQPPYAWTLISAPAWLSVGAASGVLSGTPPAATGGTMANVTVRVTDAFSAFDQVALTLNILPPGPPVLVSTNPPANARSVSPTSNVTATFNTNMAAATSTSFVVRSNLRGLRSGSYLGGGTASLTFAPMSPLKPGEEVEVTIKTSLTSTAAIALAQPDVFRFRAAAGAASANFTLRSGTLTASAEVTLDVAVGDIDGDGFVDIVQGNGAGTMRQCYWYKNNGNGTFTQRFALGTLDNIHAVLLADLDNDGDLDFVQGSNGGLTAAFLNNGTGQFSGAYTIANSGNQVLSLVAGDVDGDGDLDIVSGESIGTVYRNNGGGSFTAFDYMNISNGKALALTDIDGDGDLDCVQVSDNQDRFFLNDGTGDFVFNGTALGGAATASRGVCAADFDGDGDVDLVISAVNASTFAYFNNGAGVFTAGTGLGAGGATASTFGDLDGDGDLDFCEGRGGGQCVLYLNNGLGVFSPGTSFGVVNQHCEGLACADLDGDGKLDIVSGNSDAGIGELSYVYFNDAAAAVTGTVAAGAGNPAASQVALGSSPAALHALIAVNAGSTSSAVISGINIHISITGGAPAFGLLVSATLWRGTGAATLGGTQLETVLRNATGWNENVAGGETVIAFGTVAALSESIAPGTSRDYWVQLVFASSGTQGGSFTYTLALDQSVGAGLSGTLTSGIVGTALGGTFTLQVAGGSGDGGGGDEGCSTKERTGAAHMAALFGLLLGIAMRLQRRKTP